MIKKNNIYSQKGKYKLKENIIYEHFREEFVKLFDKFNDYNRSHIKKFRNGNTIEGLTQSDHSFFTEIYVPSIDLRTTDKKRIDFLDVTESEIGLLEWQLIIFATGFGDSFKGHKIIFVSGNIGEGKSSLVNYVFKYLYFNRKKLKRKILPILLNCQGHKATLTKERNEKGNVNFFIDSFIVKRLNNKFKIFTAPDNNEFWDWYKNQDFISSYGTDEYDILHSGYDSSMLNRKLIDLRLKEKKEINFIYYASNYYTFKYNKEIIFIFDNIDPFEIETIKDFYWKAKEIINNSPIRVIITLRPATYKKLERSIEEINSVKTVPVNSNFNKILEKRCDYLTMKIKSLEEVKPLTLNTFGNKTLKIKNNPYVSIKKITTALLNDKKHTLLTFSNKNIRNQQELLRYVFSSGFLATDELGKILLEENGNMSIPPEFVLSTIVTFGYMTYFSEKSKDEDIPGLINILSNANNRRPIQIFMKLFLLRYLSQSGFQVSKSKDEIIEIFNDCIKDFRLKKELKSTFIYSFYRLFNKGLITSPDIHKCKDIKEFTKDVKDIRISTLGKLYFNQLLIDPFYLIFVKDDVYLPNVDYFESNIYIRENYPTNRYFWLNIKNLILFLKEYGSLELLIIKEFVKYNTFDVFQNNFACDSNQLFTLHILAGLKQFINNHSLKSDHLVQFLNDKQIFYSTDISNLDSIIDYLSNEYNKIIS